jgi:hypothetical protein
VPAIGELKLRQEDHECEASLGHTFVLGLTHSTPTKQTDRILAGHGVACLQLKHSGGRGRRITSYRPTWATKQIQGQSGIPSKILLKNFFKTHTIKL